MQQLILKDFKEEHPRNGEVCLIEFHTYNLMFDKMEDAKKKRFRTLTWLEFGLLEMPYSGRFVDAEGSVVAVYECRWIPVNQLETRL